MAWPALVAALACGGRDTLPLNVFGPQASGAGAAGGTGGSTSGSTSSNGGSRAGSGGFFGMATVTTTTGAGGSPSGGSGGGGTGGGMGGVAGAFQDHLPLHKEMGTRYPPAFVDTGLTPAPARGRELPVKIHADRSLRMVPISLFGNNAAVWNGDTLLSMQMHERLSDAGVSILRFPGGSTSDTYHFDGEYPPYAIEQGWDVMSEEWAVSTAEYMRVVRALGAIPLITVNHGYASYDTTDSDGDPANAARLAADWVEYCNQPDNGENPNGGIDWARRRSADGFPDPFDVRYWEVGNEPYGAWEVGYQPDARKYAANFSIIASAMKEVDPSIYIGMSTPADPEYYEWTEDALNEGPLDVADFLVVHNYFGWISSADQLEPQSMLARTEQVRQYKDRLDTLVKAQGRDPFEVPYYFGEYNLPLPTNAYQIAHISGLFVADVIGQLIATGWAGASLWDVQNDYDPGQGLGAGDHGFLSRNQPGIVDLTPRPTYYPFYFFTRNFGFFLLDLEGSTSDVAVYASTWSDPLYGIVAVNKTNESRALSVDIPARTHLTRMNLWQLTAESPESQAVFLNGVGSNLIAGGPDPDDAKPYTLPFANGQPNIPLPPYSVVSVVIY